MTFSGKVLSKVASIEPLSTIMMASGRRLCPDRFQHPLDNLGIVECMNVRQDAHCP
jgi:hypothetical protein